MNTFPSMLAQPVFALSAAVFVLFAVVWTLLRRHKAVEYTDHDIVIQPTPLPINFTVADYGKALLSWLFLFMRTFSLAPGYYHLGKFDEKAPLLVTGNYFLTNFLLARRVRGHKVRLLVIDTKGINVWCSAGKGQFSAAEIIDKAKKCGLLDDGRIKMILPKFSMAGVNLQELRKNSIIPIIGPLYAKDVPAFLTQDKLRNQTEDVVAFGLRSRAFTAVPTAVQFFYYFLGAYVISLGNMSVQLVALATMLAFAYPLLFPWLPGKLFSNKGISLGILASALAAAVSPGGPGELLQVAVFIFGTSIFVGLSYTGNSAVSNYTSVRKETARFLPVVVLLYLALIPLNFIF